VPRSQRSAVAGDLGARAFPLARRGWDTGGVLVHSNQAPLGSVHVITHPTAHLSPEWVITSAFAVYGLLYQRVVPCSISYSAEAVSSILSSESITGCIMVTLFSHIVPPPSA